MNERKVPQLYIEQMLLNELPRERELEINQDDEVQKRLTLLKDSNEQILAAYPPATIAKEIGVRVWRDRNPASTSILQNRSLMLLAAAFILFLAGVLPFILRSTEPVQSGDELYRVKGMDPDITIFRKTTEQIEELSEDIVVKENDLLQISYNAVDTVYGTILSIDGNGVVTLHFPEQEGASMLLEHDGDVALDYSYKLDDAPGFERFFFVTGDDAFLLDAVVNAAKKLAGTKSTGRKGSLDLPEGLNQISITLTKEVSQ